MAHTFIHPAAYYARYMTLVLADPAQELNPTLALLGMANMDKLQIAATMEDMKDQPADFRPWDTLHRPSVNWLRSKKVFALMHQDAAVQNMYEILRQRKLREAIERMLIGSVGHQEITFRLREIGYEVPESAIADFRHFFWNVDIMGAADWANYFREDNRGRTRDLHEQYEAARISGPKFALYRSGVQVEVNRRKVLQELHDELYFTFQEVRALPTTEKKVDMLAALSRGLVRIDERLDASDTALVDVLKKFERFRVTTDESSIPSAIGLAPTGTLSAGRHKLLTAKEH